MSKSFSVRLPLAAVLGVFLAGCGASKIVGKVISDTVVWQANDAG